MTGGGSPSRDVRFSTQTEARGPGPGGATPGTAGIKKSARGWRRPSPARTFPPGARSTLIPIDMPRIVAQKCVQAFDGATWAATYPLKLEFSALARSMTSPAYPPIENRFEFFRLGFHRPGGRKSARIYRDRNFEKIFARAINRRGGRSPSPTLPPGAGRGGRGPWMPEPR